MQRAFSHHRKGSVLIFVAVAMVVFAGMVSLVVDIAHVRVVKMQLQFAADSAARSAATGVSSGAATSNAISAAALTVVDGTSVVVQNSDVVSGTWSGGTFTPGGASPNAIKVTVTRSSARGNAVPAWWGAILGKTTVDVTAAGIAYAKPTPMAGFIGYAGVDMKNNAFFGSYDSRNVKKPVPGGAGRKSRVGSNNAINGGNNDTIQGDFVLGPHASADPSIVLTGADLYQGSDLPTPTTPSWSPPGATPALVVNSNTVMAGGSYWYSSMTLNADLTFSGPTTLYVNGDITVGATLAASSGNPIDLTIYQYGAHAFGDSAVNGMDITANVVAPSSNFLSKNNLNYYGGGIFNTITTKNNANFYYDITLGPADGSPILSTVK